MKKILSRYFELILLTCTIVFVMIKYTLPVYGERISILFFGTLAFYYLASGVLVFLDRHRVKRMMRMMYLIGLWSVSVSVIAVMTRTLLLGMDKELLILAISSGAGTLLFVLAYFLQIQPEEKNTFNEQIRPLLLRVFPATLAAAVFLILSDYNIYQTFGTHRNDPVFTRKAVDVYEHPGDSIKLQDLQHYTDSLRKAEAEKRAPLDSK